MAEKESDFDGQKLVKESLEEMIKMTEFILGFANKFHSDDAFGVWARDHLKPTVEEAKLIMTL